jgi:asparaginyl-tRNA synthetase
MRVRSKLSFAVHKYFQENGFNYVNTPIVTGSDAEGAGEMFRVSTFDPNKAPVTEEGEIDYKQDFFGKETNLTVSGQLEAETYAMALGKVYTFGPTFRAENSNTTRHLAEFWMIEPEVAFMDLEGNMDLSEDFIKSVLSYVLEHCKDDLAFLDQRLTQEEKSKPQAQRSDMSLLEKIHFVVDNNFKRVSYTEAFDILRNSKPNKKKKFQYLIQEWGADLQSEHERYLVEKHFKCPVILFDYPATIKAFYMRLNDDEKTVRAMDVLFPGIGEIAGGSQREERLDVLQEKIKAMGIDEKELWWYLDLRKYGTAVHSGFGLGFERLVQFATGMGNIRDVIPFPRTPQNAEF